jgi:hypothetical protein
MSCGLSSEVPRKQPARGAGWKRSSDLCPIRRRRSTLKTNVRNADNECWKRLSFIRLLPLARIMLFGRRRDGTSLPACCRRPGGPKPIPGTARSTPIEGTERRRFFAVLGTPPIISPVGAAQAGIGGLLFVWVIYPDLVSKTNYRFGPEWRCTG